ncbi:hypothetical protein HPB47_020484 [Ixodes persulcatus]|uniref:Uncharacterized protein n=1 Tax=Ixodes persulcatus TaxID=34615 RepID=A0AC60QIJ7_IXOPE|nr:hypothetical protein HPB47_020484 [Ixodes persulcatus]
MTAIIAEGSLKASRIIFGEGVAGTDRGYGLMELNTGNGPNSTASQPPRTKEPEAQAGTAKENAETSRTATSTEQVRNYSQQDVSGDVQNTPVLAHEGDPNFFWTDVVGKNTKKKRARAERLQGNDPSTSNRQIENNKMATGKGDGGKDGGPPAIPTSTYRNGGHRISKPKKEILPPLPLDHYKVVIRPQEGLTVSNWSALEISKAVTTAAELCPEELAKSRVRIRKEQNIIVLSTPDIEPANRMAKAKTITLKDRQYEIAAYKAAPDNSCKGVISGIGEKYAPEYLTENIRATSPTGPAVFYARMMGQKDSVIITFQGLQIPRLVLLGNAEYRCRPYLPKEQVCDACLGHGHRKDVCPHPEKGRCATCGCLGGAMEDHVCSPHCIHCEGNHPYNDPQCPARRKAPYNKAWIQKQQTQKRNLQQAEISNTQNIQPDTASQLLPPTRNSQAHWPALEGGGFETPNPYALIASGLESYARTLAQAPHATQGPIVDPTDTGPSGGIRGRSRSRKKSQVKNPHQPQQLPRLLPQQQGGSHRQGPSGLAAVNTQRTRLGRTKAGRALLRRLGYRTPASSLDKGGQKPAPPAIAARVRVMPIPKNMHPQVNAGRRLARVRYLRRRYHGDPDVLYTDAASYPSPSGGKCIAVCDSDGRNGTSASLKGSPSCAEAEEAAIALAISTTQYRAEFDCNTTVTIITDSQAACRAWAGNLLSTWSNQILSNLDHTRLPLVRIVWTPGHASLPGNGSVDALARGLTIRALHREGTTVGDNTSREDEQEREPQTPHLETFNHVTEYYRSQRKKYPPPHKDLNRQEASEWRKLQTHSFPNLLHLHRSFPDRYRSVCPGCQSPEPSLYHCTWACPSPVGVGVMPVPNPTTTSWEAALLSSRPERQRALLERARRVAVACGALDLGT